MNNQEVYRSVLQKVSEVTGIEESEIIGKKRDKLIVEARHTLRYLLFKNDINKRGVAKLTGCNHATILSAINRFDNLLQTEPAFREKMQMNYSDLLKLRIKKPVYIIGKVTGEPYASCFAKFQTREKQLNDAGYIAINPMNLVPKDTPWHEAMRICVGALVQCYAVNPLDDWADSRGAKTEMFLAQELKINIMYKF